MRQVLYSPQEVAQTLGIGRTKVYELIGEGLLKKVKIGNSSKIPLSSIEAFLAAHGCGEEMLV
jgi:excisionase family DNA binding protein